MRPVRGVIRTSPFSHRAEVAGRVRERVRVESAALPGSTRGDHATGRRRPARRCRARRRMPRPRARRRGCVVRRRRGGRPFASNRSARRACRCRAAASARNAVYSSVVVPWVSTTPRVSGSRARSRARRAIAEPSRPGASAQLGRASMVAVRSSKPAGIAATRRRSWSAPSVGALRPVSRVDRRGDRAAGREQPEAPAGWLGNPATLPDR